MKTEKRVRKGRNKKLGGKNLLKKLTCGIGRG